MVVGWRETFNELAEANACIFKIGEIAEDVKSFNGRVGFYVEQFKRMEIMWKTDGGDAALGRFYTAYYRDISYIVSSAVQICDKMAAAGVAEVLFLSYERLASVYGCRVAELLSCLKIFGLHIRDSELEQKIVALDCIGRRIKQGYSAVLPQKSALTI